MKFVIELRTEGAVRFIRFADFGYSFLERLPTAATRFHTKKAAKSCACIFGLVRGAFNIVDLQTLPGRFFDFADHGQSQPKLTN